VRYLPKWLGWSGRDLARRFDLSPEHVSRIDSLLDQIGAVLSARLDIRLVRVEGHTDSRANGEYNLNLSNQPAAAVREYLVTAGIAGERLESQGFGETRPIDTNATSAGRAANRRVEFVIVEQEGCRDGEATPGAPARAPAR
jgi:outer membrane protein OmpA-like peptidoglycan-associated protein